jgi:ACR3 family arsenite transporter
MTVVGVHIEVPVMLSMVRIVNASKGWYEARRCSNYRRATQ